MGFAKVDGIPTDWRGTIRSATGETRGTARRDQRPAVVMVDGVLYMWGETPATRSSPGPGTTRTWEHGFKLEQSFGSPAFLNFGKL
jgi:hypothetical protein